MSGIPEFERREPDGNVYSRWSWDGRAVELQQSRFGMHPLYCWAQPDGIALADSPLSLLGLGAPPELDEAAIATFLRLGFFLGEDTPFRSVRAVPADARLTWSARDGLRVERPARSPPRASGLTRAEAIEAHIELTRAAVLRCLPQEDYVMPLSGGCDSRHLLLELCRAGRPPRHCVTAQMLPDRANDDTTVARQLCTALGLRQQVVRQPLSLVGAVRRKNRLTGLCCSEHSWAVPLVETLRRQTRLLVDGIAGDVLTTCFLITPERIGLCERGDIRNLAQSLLGDTELGLSLMLSPAARRRFGRELAVERLSQALEPHLALPNALSSFSLANRTRREIELYTYAMYGPEVKVLAPYLDETLVDMLLATPQAWFADGCFHQDTIRRAFPVQAAIPFASSGPARKCRPMAVLAAPTARGPAGVRCGLPAGHACRGHGKRLA